MDTPLTVKFFFFEAERIASALTVVLILNRTKDYPPMKNSTPQPTDVVNYHENRSWSMAIRPRFGAKCNGPQTNGERAAAPASFHTDGKMKDDIQ